MRVALINQMLFHTRMEVDKDRLLEDRMMSIPYHGVTVYTTTYSLNPFEYLVLKGLKIEAKALVITGAPIANFHLAQEVYSEVVNQFPECGVTYIGSWTDQMLFILTKVEVDDS